MKINYLNLKQTVLLITLLIPVFMVSCNQNSKTANDILAEKLDSLFAQRYGEGTPGGSAIILKGNDVVYEKSWGVANYKTNATIDSNTFFNIASVSKQFTAMAILKLHEEGKLSIEDNVKQYFPEFKADFFKKIKIKHLLSHSSGLPDDRPRTDRNFVLTATDMQSIEFYKELNKINFEPGTNYEYQNPTFQLCYAIIEKVTGKSFEEYMRENIFDPAGMKETVYFEDGRDIPRMAHGYEPADEAKTAWNEYDYGEESFFGTKADGGIYTSISEFINWEKALRNNVIISDSLKQVAHSVITPVSGSTFSDYQNRANTGYGYGWFIEEIPGWPKKVYHTGDNGGFQIYAGRFPEKEVLVLVFENRHDNDRWSMVKEIDNIMKEAGLLD